MRITKYLLVFLCFIPLFVFRDFTPNNELKYLSISDEALRDGHFFTFWNHGVPYADKPPLYLWIVMLGKWLLGTHSMLFLGMFSLLPALGTLAVMERWVSPYLSPAYRTSALLLMMTSGLFVGSAVVMRMDMLMCFFIVLALHTFFKQYTRKAGKWDGVLLPVYIFLAVFSKGPMGVLVPLVSMTAFLILQKKGRLFFRYMGWLQWGILLGLCAAWFGAVYAEGGNAYLHNLLFHQTVNRAVDAFHHKQPVWYYLKTIWYSLAPWVLFYFSAIYMGLRRQLLDTDVKKFFLVIITTTFIALSIFSGKLDIYLLPIFPFIGYLAFLMLPDLPQGWLRVTVGIPAGILALAFPAYLAIMYRIDLPAGISGLTVLALSGSAWVSLYFLFRKRITQSANSLAIGLLITILIGSLIVCGLNAMIGFREISQKAQTIAQEKGIENFYYYPFRSAENMDVYLKKEISPVNTEQLRSLSERENFILFVREKERLRNKELQVVTDGRESYSIGDYRIIVY